MIIVDFVLSIFSLIASGFFALYNLVVFIGHNGGLLVLFLGTLLVTLLSSVAFYLFIFINLLIPQLIFIAVMAYKTKPDEDSFTKYLDRMFEFGEKETQTQPTPSTDTKNGDSFVQSQINKLVNKVTNNFSVFYAKRQAKQSVFHYDCGILRLAFFGNTRFVGIFGTWFPF